MDKIFVNIIDFFRFVGGGVAVTFNALAGVSFSRAAVRRWFEQMSAVGIDSLPIVIITMTFIGAVFALQLTSIFVMFGAGNYVGSVLTIALAREMMPIFTGVVVAARVGASFAAEIGTMKITNQIDALKTLATDPVAYLVTPRLYSLMIMMPVLGTFGMLVATFGGAYVSAHNGVSYALFWESASAFLQPYDLVGGIIKTIVFGMIITGTACYIGLSTDGGAKGVGKSTTQAVVWGIVFIFASNFLMSYILITVHDKILKLGF